MQIDLYFKISLVSVRKIGKRRVRVKERPIRRLLEPRQEMMVSWIRMAERKCMDSICTLTKDLVDRPDGLDVGHEENGRIKSLLGYWNGQLQ